MARSKSVPKPTPKTKKEKVETENKTRKRPRFSSATRCRRAFRKYNSNPKMHTGGTHGGTARYLREMHAEMLQRGLEPAFVPPENRCDPALFEGNNMRLRKDAVQLVKYATEVWILKLLERTSKVLLASGAGITLKAQHLDAALALSS